MRLVKRGSTTAFFTSSVSRATISFGVFAGASRPNQLAISKSGTPASDIVGSSGMSFERSGPATARSLSLPPSDIDFADGGPVSMTSTTPATTSVIAGAVPRYGTWLSCVCVLSLNSSIPRCIALPVPSEA